MTIAPYAGPAPQSPAVEFATSSERVVAPFVPREWRTSVARTIDAHATASDEHASKAESEQLPSIGSFLHAPDEVAAAREDWPFQDAGEETTELSGELSGSGSPVAGSGERIEPEPLPMWGDEDLLDIMPSPSAAASRPRAADDAAAEPGSVAGSIEHTESAARALETLAQRVRSGELLLPGYAAELGDAAALAAALAALLGIRR